MNLSKPWVEWRTEEPGVLHSMGSQRVGSDLGTEQQHCWTLLYSVDIPRSSCAFVVQALKPAFYQGPQVPFTVLENVFRNQNLGAKYAHCYFIIPFRLSQLTEFRNIYVYSHIHSHIYSYFFISVHLFVCLCVCVATSSYWCLQFQ